MHTQVGQFLMALALQGPWPAPDVTSAAGGHVAEIRKAAGQERVADGIARWRVSVFALGTGGEREPSWSSAYPHRPGQRYALSDDGLVLAQVCEAYASGRPMVRLHREGVETASIEGARLGIEKRDMVPADGELLWLAEGVAPRFEWVESPHGPELRLELACADGRERAFDALSGETARGSTSFVAEIAPAVAAEMTSQCDVPYVNEVRAPRHARSGVPFSIEVHGAFPTTGWRLVGFRLDPAELLIEPLAVRASGAVAQQISRFESTVQLHGLPPGRHVVTLRGRGEGPAIESTIEVLPGRLLLRLGTTGGFLGLREEVEVYEGGVARATSRFYEGERLALLRQAEFAALIGQAGRIPARDERSTTAGSDLREFTLSLWREGRWITVVVDDGSARGAVGALIAGVQTATARLTRPPVR